MIFQLGLITNDTEVFFFSSFPSETYEGHCAGISQVLGICDNLATIQAVQFQTSEKISSIFFFHFHDLDLFCRSQGFTHFGDFVKESMNKMVCSHRFMNQFPSYLA